MYKYFVVDTVLLTHQKKRKDQNSEGGCTNNYTCWQYHW